MAETEIIVDCKTGARTERPFTRPEPAEPEPVSMDAIKAVLAALPIGLTAEQIDALCEGN